MPGIRSLRRPVASCPLRRWTTRVVKVLDLKTPASGEAERNDYDNIAHLTARDQVKFVICDRADYLWARSKITASAIAPNCWRPSACPGCLAMSGTSWCA